MRNRQCRGSNLLPGSEYISYWFKQYLFRSAGTNYIFHFQLCKDNLSVVQIG